MLKRLIMFPIIAFALHKGLRGFGEALMQVSHVQLDHPSSTLPALTFFQKALYIVYCADWYMLGLPFTLLVAGLAIWCYLTVSRRKHDHKELAVAAISFVGVAAGVDVAWRRVVGLLRPSLAPGSYDVNHANLAFLSAYVLTVVLCGVLWFVLLVGLERLSKQNGLRALITLFGVGVGAAVLAYMAEWITILWMLSAVAGAAFLWALSAFVRSKRQSGGVRRELNGAGEKLRARLHACLDGDTMEKGGRCVRLFCGAGMALIVLFAVCGAIGVCLENRRGVLKTENTRECEGGSKPLYNVVLINIDTLRADHLSCYGYNRPTSPNIDRFAKNAVVFENASVGASWTKPSVASLFTGLYASSHTARNHGDALPLAARTLSEMLLERGYSTAGFVTNPNIKSIFNFDQGFEFYDESLTIDRVYRKSWEDCKVALRHIPLRFGVYQGDTGGVLTSKAISWLKSCTAPFFLYVHYMDPHDPYAPPPPYDEAFAPDDANDPAQRSAALYDGEIRYTDAQIQRLLDAVNELGLMETTLIVLTADHGEEFSEHGGSGHGETLYEEVLRVPLILRFPGMARKGKRVAQLVSQVDVTPTILDFLSIAYDKEAFHGVSLMPLVKGEADGRNRRVAFSELCSATASTTLPVAAPYNLRAIRASGWKLILTVASPRKRQGEELYHLAEDPAEQRNLASEESDVVERLREELKRAWSEATQKALTPEAAAFDWETLGQLKALGYVQ